MRVDLIIVFVWGLKLTDCRILITAGMFWRDGGGEGWAQAGIMRSVGEGGDGEEVQSSQ